MRALIAALVVTFTIAVVASVFAIWPVVADAPWEKNAVVQPVIDRTAEIRCEGALSYRDSLIAASAGEIWRYESQLDEADREISRFC